MKTYSTLLFCIFAVLFTGCNPTDEPTDNPIDNPIDETYNDNITLTSDSIKISSKGGIQSTTVYCERNVNAQSDVAWIHLSNYRLKENNTIAFEFMIDSYNGTDIRIGHVDIYNENASKTITISQSGANIVSIEGSQTIFYDNGGIGIFKIIGTNDYEIQVSENWVTITSNKDNEVTLSIAQLLKEVKSRVCDISIVDKASGEQKSITISQERMLQFSKYFISLEEGDSEKLNCTAKDSVYRENIYYSSSNEGIASITKAGYLNAHMYGRCMVYATTEDELYTDSCEISINKFDIQKHITISIEDKITDSEKGTHSVYYTIKNTSNKIVAILKTWIYFNGNAQIGDTNTHMLYGNSEYVRQSWRYSSAMTIGYEVFYRYNGTEYRMFKSTFLDSYF